MNKLIIVTGLPNSGKNEYIKKKYYNTYKVINGESYIDKTVNINIKAIEESRQKCLEEFKVRIVLTAHPTQFYPGSVLGIITDLTEAIRENDDTVIQLAVAVQRGLLPKRL